MTTRTDSTKSVSFLFRPVGYRNTNGKSPTVEEVENWVQKEKPGAIKQQPNLTFIGFGLGIVGVGLGILGLKKDNGSLKWLGGLLSLLGISGGGTGIMWSKLVNEMRKVFSSLNDSSSSNSKANDPLRDIEGKNDEEKEKNAIRMLNDTITHNTQKETALWVLLKIGNEDCLTAIKNFIEDKTRNISVRKAFLNTVASDSRRKEFAKNLLVDIIKNHDLELSIKAIEFLRKEFQNFSEQEKTSLKGILIELINKNLNNDSYTDLVQEAVRAFTITVIYKKEEAIPILEDIAKIEGIEQAPNNFKGYVSDCIKYLKNE